MELGAWAAFCSVLDAAQTLERLRAWGVALCSYQEPCLDTTTSVRKALSDITSRTCSWSAASCASA